MNEKDTPAERAVTSVDWATSVAAVLVMFLPGQEEGNAAVDILFGAVNPSGRLPLTLPNSENEVGFTKAQYPGVARGGLLVANYSEGLNVGYRWYNSMNVTPRFAFGESCLACKDCNSSLAPSLNCTTD